MKTSITQNHNLKESR